MKLPRMSPPRGFRRLPDRVREKIAGALKGQVDQHLIEAFFMGLDEAVNIWSYQASTPADATRSHEALRELIQDVTRLRDRFQTLQRCHLDLLALLAENALPFSIATLDALLGRLADDARLVLEETRRGRGRPATPEVTQLIVSIADFFEHILNIPPAATEGSFLFERIVGLVLWETIGERDVEYIHRLCVTSLNHRKNPE